MIKLKVKCNLEEFQELLKKAEQQISDLKKTMEVIDSFKIEIGTDIDN